MAAETCLTRCFAALDAHDYAQAEQHATEAMNKEASSDAAAFYLGMSLFFQKKYRKAERAFKRVRATADIAADLMYYHGVCEYQLHMFAEAAGHLEQATGLRPQDGAAWDSLGSCHLQLGHTREARAAFETAVSCDERQPQFLHHLALLLYEQRHFAEAATQLRQALRVAGSAQERHVLGLDLGMALMESGQFAEAAAVLEQCQGATGEVALAHHALGVCYGEMGRLDDSIASLSRALALSPSYVLSLRALGWTYMQQGDAEAAAINLDHALALEPGSSELMALAADAHAKCGREDKAVALYKASLAIDAKQPAVSAALTRLASPLRNRFALLLGPASAGLAFAGDVSNVAATLRAQGMQDSHVVVLAGEDATQARLEESVAMLQAAMKEEAQLLVYVAAAVGKYSSSNTYIHLHGGRLPIPKLLALFSFAHQRSCLLLDCVPSPSLGTPTEALCKETLQSIQHHVTTARLAVALTCITPPAARPATSMISSLACAAFQGAGCGMHACGECTRLKRVAGGEGLTAAQLVVWLEHHLQQKNLCVGTHVGDALSEIDFPRE